MLVAMSGRHTSSVMRTSKLVEEGDKSPCLLLKCSYILFQVQTNVKLNILNDTSLLSVEKCPIVPYIYM